MYEILELSQEKDGELTSRKETWELSLFSLACGDQEETWFTCITK